MIRSLLYGAAYLTISAGIGYAGAEPAVQPVHIVPEKPPGQPNPHTLPFPPGVGVLPCVILQPAVPAELPKRRI